MLQILRQRGQNDIAFIFKHLLDNPSKAKSVRNFISSNLQPAEDLSALEGLALLFDHDLSVSTYNGVREKTKNVLPCYGKVLEEKKNCRPAGIIADEVNVQVPMQELSNHTASRILSIPDINSKVKELQENVNSNLEVEMISKYGTDGSGVK